MIENKKITKVSSSWDRNVYDFEDGTVSVMYYETKEDGNITGVYFRDFLSKADYEIDVLDEKTEILIAPSQKQPEAVASNGCHHNFRFWYNKLEICIDCGASRSK